MSNSLRIRQDRSKLGDDGGKRRCQLLGSTEGHGSEQLDGSLFRPPLLLLQTSEERGQDDVDTVAGQARHEDLGGVLARFSDIRRAVTEGLKQKGEDVFDVGLENSAEGCRKGPEEV